MRQKVVWEEATGKWNLRLWEPWEGQMVLGVREANLNALGGPAGGHSAHFCEAMGLLLAVLLLLLLN